MATPTTNYALSKPAVGSATDQDLWGNELNTDLDSIDTLMRVAITIATQSSQTTGFTADASISVKKLYPCDATGGAFAATLPVAATAGNGATVYFKKTDSSANAITITRAGSDTIDGATTQAISTRYDCYGLVSDGSSTWNIISKPTTVKSLVLVTQKFTSNGTYTPTSGMVYCIAKVYGGGGGGGAGVSGAGGGQGALAEGTISAATISTSQTVTIGAAGAAGTSTGNGGTGGTSSLGTLLTAAGGTGGYGNAATGGTVGGAGGAAGGSSLSYGLSGASGASGGSVSGYFAGGTGGGWGSGAGAAQSGAGSAAVANTGGGGGGGVNSSSGGAGGSGLVVITEYCLQ